MNIHFAAKALHGDVASRDTVLCPGPGHSAADRSLSVTFNADAPDGFLVNSFANDDWQVCRDHVRALLGLGSFERHGGHERTAAQITPPTSSPEMVQRREFALSLWQEACPMRGTVAERYLIGRGIILTADAFRGHALRFHSACPFRLDSGETVRLPAMLGAMTNVETGDFQGIHRTALQVDGGGKARVRGLDDAKKMLGPSKGACVRLSSDDSVTCGLGLGEGIETALTVIGNFGFSPVWATLTAGTLARFPVLPGIDCLSIFADNDASGTGGNAANLCAEGWTAAGRECVIWAPPTVGADFNDLVGRVAA
jgi:putative DNA primase/helicase